MRAVRYVVLLATALLAAAILVPTARAATTSAIGSITIDPGPFTFGDGVTFTGQVSCDVAGSEELVVQVGQAGSTALVLVPIDCETTPTAWSALVQTSYPNPLAPGPASISVSVGGTEHAAAMVVLQNPPNPRYYLALGDSLATGYKATPGAGYVDDLYRANQARFPGLVLADLACGGTTTAELLNGGNCYGATSQLAVAKAFLAAHAGDVAFITIDVGGDDLQACSFNPTCITNALSTLGPNLAQILQQLQAAAGTAVPIYGMDYFNPELVRWVNPPVGTDPILAFSVDIVNQLNSTLTATYAGANVPMAAVASAFAIDDTTPVFDAQLQATVPTNVSMACALFTNTPACTAPPITSAEIHPNDAGYALIAAAFGPLFPAPPSPTTTTTTANPSSTSTPVVVAVPRFTG